MANLLLIEDDSLLTNGMVPVLQDYGHTSSVAGDAAAALGVLGTDQAFDLVILDVMLPLGGAFDDGQGGLEAGVEILCRIRNDPNLAHRKDVPVLVYSVRGGTERIRCALEALGATVITKGGDPRGVLDAISRALDDGEA